MRFFSRVLCAISGHDDYWCYNRYRFPGRRECKRCGRVEILKIIRAQEVWTEEV